MNEHIRRHRVSYLAVIVVAVVLFALLPMWTWLAE